MTTSKHKTKWSVVVAVAGDRDLIKALMKEAFQEALEGEMTQFLGAAPSERSESRSGYRAGYCGRRLVTHIGKLELRVPRDRGGEFSTALSRAFYWQQLLDDGVVSRGSEIAKREGLHHSMVNERLRLTLRVIQPFGARPAAHRSQ